MVSGNYRTGRRRVTWSIFELRSIVHGRFVVISTGNFAGSWRGKEKACLRRDYDASVRVAGVDLL